MLRSFTGLSHLTRIMVALALVVLLQALSGCAYKHHKVDPADPLERYNRKMYAFNKVVDRLYIRPVTEVYSRFMPTFVQNMVNNFFQNLGEIPTIANDILCGQFSHARSDAARFVLNTTWGIGGLFDVAAKVGRERRRVDFGQTMAYLGYKQSTYFVIPILGPSTIRDAGGRFVNYGMSVYPYIRPSGVRYSLYALNAIDVRAELLKTAPLLEESFDEYTLVRDLYLQHRQAEINGNRVNKGDGAANTPPLEGPPD